MRITYFIGFAVATVLVAWLTAFYYPQPVDKIICSSTLTRKSAYALDPVFTVGITLYFSAANRGRLSIYGSAANKSQMWHIQRAFKFNYTVQEKGTIELNVNHVWKHPSDNTSDDIFIRNVLDIGDGQQRTIMLRKFENLYFIMEDPSTPIFVCSAPE